MKTSINQFPKYSVSYQSSKTESSTTLFELEKEATDTYNSIAADLLYETNRLEDSHWRNNTEGLEVELKKIQAIPAEDIEEILSAETEEDQDDLWNKAIFTYSTTILSKVTLLSDEWSDEKNEFLIKESERKYSSYSTLPFSKDCIDLETGENVTMKGAIE